MSPARSAKKTADEAPGVETRDWTQILALYSLL